MFDKKDKNINYTKEALRMQLKQDALKKIERIKDNVERENPVSYGSYEEGMLFIIEELDDVLENWVER